MDAVINLFCRKVIRGRTNTAYVFFSTAETHYSFASHLLRQKKSRFKAKKYYQIWIYQYALVPQFKTGYLSNSIYRGHIATNFLSCCLLFWWDCREFKNIWLTLYLQSKRRISTTLLWTYLYMSVLAMESLLKQNICFDWDILRHKGHY